jgi:hypothetical protein
MTETDSLRDHLKACLPRLKGAWVSGRSKYEAPFAHAIEADLETGRYWDCVWQGLHLELKKGNIWLDLVRYSEYVLKTTPESQVPVVTVFMLYKDETITDLIGTTTDAIVRELRLSERSAADLLRIATEVPRALNAQASLSPKDVMRIAKFHVRRHAAW